jgi:putative phosphotransacetylase
MSTYKDYESSRPEKVSFSNSLKYENDLVKVIVEEVIKTLKAESLESKSSDNQYPNIPLGVSNRHIHLTQETFAKLFGEETKFEDDRPLYQPGEFASKYSLTIIGPRMRAIQNVRILGPLRNYDQVEISLSDSIYLGADAPYRNSGDLKDAVPMTFVGPKSSVYLEKCAIIASRHIHMTSKDAKTFGVEEGDYCRVRIPGVKSTVFENVLVRVNDSWKLQMHLDTDDANAANVRGEVTVEFVGKM